MFWSPAILHASHRLRYPSVAYELPGMHFRAEDYGYDGGLLQILEFGGDLELHAVLPLASEEELV